MTHFHILGAGAIGCLFASCLHKAGAEVCLITRSEESAELINNQGILIDGERFAINAKTYSEISSIDCLLLCCKSHQTQSALINIAHAINLNTQIIFLQNGMGQHAVANTMFPSNSIYAGISTEGATKVATGSVKHAGRGSTSFGQLYGPSKPLPDRLFNLAISTQKDEDINTGLWRKLAINAAINGLTVKYNCRNGELIAQQKIYNDMVGICEDIEAIFAAESIFLGDRVLSLASTVCQNTAENISSMLQDTRNARPTEFMYIYGFLIAKAKYHGLSVKHLYDLKSDIYPEEEPCV
jgi:2-dehydropantoate 2-reductase